MMLFDHFWLLYHNLCVLWEYNEFFNAGYSFASYYLTSTWRKLGRYAVMFMFFYVSGICCFFSRNNFRRVIKLSISSITLTLASCLISKFTAFQCVVWCGVLTCYTIYTAVFIWIGKQHSEIFYVNIVLFLIIIAILFQFLQPTMKNTNALIYFGIPQDTYVPDFEYVSPPVWAWTFLVGALIGRLVFYGGRCGNGIHFNAKSANDIISRVGRDALPIYICQFPFIYLFMKLLYFIATI